MPKRKAKLCFVLMPFKDELKEVYWKAIKPACTQAGFASLRVDELKGTFNINRKIIEHIFSSDAIVADLTDWNPNVFYEMGLAHAIDNKTIMIIQQKDKLPFDVSTYRCLQYEQTETGLTRLTEGIVESLLSLEEWRQHPTNPAQDFKPPDHFIPKSAMESLRRELQEKEKLLRSALPKGEREKLQQQVQNLQYEMETKEKQFQDAKSNWQALQKELTQKTTENIKLKEDLKRLLSKSEQQTTPTPSFQLRSQPLESLSEEQVREMLEKTDFFDSRLNKKGKGLRHQFEALEQKGEKLVIDHTTGLTWQQSGSPKYMNYATAEKHLRELNDQRFAGYDDWRLPTLEEAMSLMAPKKFDDLYLDPKFDRTQQWIWTADKEYAGAAWYVNFYFGNCYHYDLTNYYFVRAVR